MPIKGAFRKYIYPVAALSGSIIGVGIFSLPYAAMKSGIWPMLAYFLVLTLAVVGIHLVFAEISLKTPDFKRFPGFVTHHLGKWTGAFALISIVFGSFGVLLAYLIVGGEFLSGIFQPFLGGGTLLYTIFYFIAASAVILFGIKTVARFELLALALLLLSFVFILIGAFSQIKFGNIFSRPSAVDWRNLFLPYGAIVFSLWGTGLIPEIEEMLRGNKKNVKKIIAISTLIPAIVYVLFTFLILGVTGGQTTESALSGLKNFLGKGVFSVALFAGVLATFTAFITQGLTLKKVLMYDAGIKEWQAFVISSLTPLVILLMGFKSFLGILSFTGGFLLSADGILILLMYKKNGGRKIIIYPLGLVFLLGIVYQALYFIK